VWDVIKNLSLKFVGMEEFVPTAKAPADLIRQKVVESQVVTVQAAGSNCGAGWPDR
jgi:hypothetical protein